MGVIPAGRLANGVPLTGVEASVLSSVAVWANLNASWYNTTFAYRIGRITSISVAGILLLIEPIMSLIGFLGFLFFHIGLMSLKPIPVSLPRIAATSHQIVSLAGTSHLVTTNPAHVTTLHSRGAFAMRQPHRPSDYLASTPWSQGDDDFYELSTNSYDALIHTDYTILQDMGAAEIFEVPLGILTGVNAVVTKQIIDDFSDIHVGEDVSDICQSFDLEIKNQVESNFAWFHQTSMQNASMLTSLKSQMELDFSKYELWRVHLLQRGMYFHASSFDSTIVGWENAKLGLLAAGLNLENAVAADIIAQEEAVVREMEQNEAKMREKSSDYQLVIAEESERLSRRLSEFDGMISAQNSTLSKLNSIHVPDYLNLESKYGITVGGGGHVGPSGGSISGVSSSVGTYSYSVPNPAAPTVYGLIEMASGELTRYQNMRQAVQIEINELSGAFNRRTEQMKQQQEKRLEELNSAKERAIHAIRKDSREVNDIAEQNSLDELSPYDQLSNRSQKIWNRPQNILAEKAHVYVDLVNQMESFRVRIEQDVLQNIERITSPSFPSPPRYGSMTTHWVVIDGLPHCEIMQMSVVQFNNMNVIQREQGEAFSLLGINQHEILSYKMGKNKISEALMFLFREGAIGPKVFKTINRCKNPQLIPVEA